MRSTPKASPTMISASIASQSANSRFSAFLGPTASFSMSWWRSGGVIEPQMSFIFFAGDNLPCESLVIPIVRQELFLGCV